MITLDLERLRALALDVKHTEATWELVHFVVSRVLTTADADFIAAVSPQAVLALVDRLEAAEAKLQGETDAKER